MDKCLLLQTVNQLWHQWLPNTSHIIYMMQILGTHWLILLLLSSWQSPFKPSHCSNESVVHSLLLSTQVNSEVDYRNRILHNPVTLYFRPTSLVGRIYMYATFYIFCDRFLQWNFFLQNFKYTNETCVFWDPVRKWACFTLKIMSFSGVYIWKWPMTPFLYIPHRKVLLYEQWKHRCCNVIYLFYYQNVVIKRDL